MNSYSVYRASFYVMMSVATTALCLDTTETAFGAYYPVIVSAAGFAAFFLVDRNPRWAIPRWAVNLLGLATLILPYVEYNVDEDQMIRAIGHWLILLQLVMYVLPKSAREDWFLFGLGLLEVLIGSMINETDQVGIWLFVWAMSAVWVLNLFFLQREARRFLDKTEPTGFRSESIFDHRGSTTLGLMAEDPYRGLIDPLFVLASVRVMLAALALGGMIFLFMPRQSGAARSRNSFAPTRHLTGFGEEVQLGQLGEILEDDSVVMSVEFTDGDGSPTRPTTEPLWRGSTMAQYENGKWHRQRLAGASLPVLRTRSGLLRQSIRLEANDSRSLFGIRPMVKLEASGQRNPPGINGVDGTLYRGEVRGGAYDAYDYYVTSNLDANAPQRSEAIPNLSRMELLLGIPDDIKARFRRIAEPVVAGVKAEGAAGIEEKARKLEAYLRDSGEFGYSLQMEVSNPALDPVEDFLINRKEGHCEYFASALALLLRSIDIPSRMVNGFKGGDWNEVTRAMYVRRKHAHSWVEAYLGRTDDGLANWISLDPTPGLARERSVAEVGGFASNFRTLTDTIRHIWVFYVLGFDHDRQNKLVYGPIRALASEVTHGFSLLNTSIRTFFRQVFGFENLSSLISIRGFFVSFILLTTLVLGLRSIFWLIRRLVRMYRGSETDSANIVAGILFYRRLALTLGKFGVKREPAETQQEFARRAARFLETRNSDALPVTEVPGLVVDAFYRVRFGHLELATETLRELEHRLDDLDESLKPD